MNLFVDNKSENMQSFDELIGADQKYVRSTQVTLNDYGCSASGITDDRKDSFESSNEQHISNLSNNRGCNVSITQGVDAGNYMATVNTNAVTYDRLIKMIKGLDLQDDGITMNHKIKSIEIDYCRAIVDEDMLCESMDYINGKALDDADIALKFALLFASRNFDALAMKETKIRNAMLTLLEKNFTNANLYRLENKKRLYNSITLLGEYYHRVRVANDSPIKVLGESLLRLLIDEVSLQHNANDLNLAKLVLSQITLNGSIMRGKHQAEIAELLFQIRKNLIEQPDLKANIKAIFLMTLDLYYNNFNSLGPELEKMYTNYYVMKGDDYSNSQGTAWEYSISPTTECQTYKVNEVLHLSNSVAPTSLTHNCESSEDYGNYNNYEVENKNAAEFDNSDYCNEYLENETECEGHNKKWSEQIGEDCLLNNIINDSTPSVVEIIEYKSSRDAGFEHKSELIESQCTTNDNLHKNNEYKYHKSGLSHHSQETKLQKFPKESHSTTAESRVSSSHRFCEEEEDGKPLPRWRTTRFSRNNQQQKDGNFRHWQRYPRHHHEDDQHSVRSENENIRLYSINDRLKHDHDKIARAGHNSFYDAIVNSNWDRRSQRDDRSERSYLSNYERGSPRRGVRLCNNRSSYNKPPRFQKNYNNTNANLNSNINSNIQFTADDKKIATVSWRRASYNKSSDFDLNRQSNHVELQPSTSEKHRSRTLPRTAKSRAQEYARGTSSNNIQESVKHNRRISNKHDRTRARSFNNQFSSQGNLIGNLELPYHCSASNYECKNTTNIEEQSSK